MENYPDNIRGHDGNPRSPFYDDGGLDLFIDTRMCELIERGMSVEEAETQAYAESKLQGDDI